LPSHTDAQDRAFRELGDLLPIPLAVTRTADGAVLFANAAFRDGFGVGDESDELSALDFYADPSDRDKLLSRMRGDGVILGESVLLRLRDGRERWSEVSVRSMSFEGTAALVTCFHDLTRFKESEAELGSNARFFRELLEGVADAVVVTDTDGTVVFVNAAARSVFGYGEGALLGESVDLLVPSAHRKSHSVHRAGYVASASRRPMGSGLSLEGQRRDGTVFPIDVSLSPVDFDQGTLIVATIRDQTEIQRLEGSLRAAQRMEAVGRLAGGVAHDFNNLLQVVHIEAEMLPGIASSPAAVTEAAASILDVSRRAAKLTRQLLAFSRRQVMSPELVDLDAAIDELEPLLKRLLTEAIEVDLALAGGLPNVFIDPTQFEQILVNLSVNARDAMQRGGALRIRTGLRSFTDKASAGDVGGRIGDFVTLSVQDTGAGMDRDTQARIFEPFFTTKEMGRGTGLGLATVYGIVKQSGGFIWVESAPGRGTTFRIFFPADYTEPAPASTQSPSSTSTQSGAETVLVLEDDDDVRRSVCSVLKRLGYLVLEASDGAQAVGIVEQHAGTIDLLLSDVVLPGPDGPEVASELMKVRPDMKVVMMSGYPDDLDTIRGVLKSGVAWLPKPFEPSELAVAIRKALDSG